MIKKGPSGASQPDIYLSLNQYYVLSVKFWKLSYSALLKQLLKRRQNQISSDYLPIFQSTYFNLIIIA